MIPIPLTGKRRVFGQVAIRTDFEFPCNGIISKLPAPSPPVGNLAETHFQAVRGFTP